MLSALQAETAGDLIRDYTMAKTAFAPAVAGDMHRVQSFLREIEKQLVSSYEMRQLNQEPAGGDTSSVDVLLRLHKAMIEAGMIKKRTESTVGTKDSAPALTPTHA